MIYLYKLYLHVKPYPSVLLLLYTMFPKISNFHVKKTKKYAQTVKDDFIWKNRATSNSLERRSVSKTLPLTVFCLTDRRLTVSVKPKPTFGSVSELLSKNFFEQVVVGGYETLFSVGLEVLKSLHVDLTENSIEIYKKK